MSLRAGDASLCDVEGTVFARAGIDHLGLGGMTTSYLFGPHDRRGADDARAGAYASGGLQIRTGFGEAIWRPVRNPETLQISSFLDENPKGFGLMQRARDYAAFEDDVQHWEWRPSLWLEPLGAWGPGAVTLLEIPSDSEFNENVLAYWRPKVALAAGAELPFSYRQHWCWQPPEPPALAQVSGTRSGAAPENRRRFLVDFTAPASPPPATSRSSSAPLQGRSPRAPSTATPSATHRPGRLRPRSEGREILRIAAQSATRRHAAHRNLALTVGPRDRIHAPPGAGPGARRKTRISARPSPRRCPPRRRCPCRCRI